MLSLSGLSLPLTHTKLYQDLIISMESQDANQRFQKVKQAVAKSSFLLQEKKYYEFAQKIKLLSNRKSQSNKYDECIAFLRLGAEALLQIQDSDINISNDLIQTLLDIYQKNKQLWTSETQKQFQKLLHIRQNQKIVDYYTFILKKICKTRDCPLIAEELVDIYINNNQFVKAEAHVLEMELYNVEKFLLCWRKVVYQDEFFAICCRVALLRGLFFNFDEAMVILSQVPPQNPFFKFSKYLIVSIQLKSKESFEKIGECYQPFLAKDEMFNKIYIMYGVYFFKKETQSAKGLSGLLSMFDS